MRAEGDCYEAANRALLGAPDALLVHGTCLGTGPIEGVRFGHAWVEIGGLVIDRSNGRDAKLPRALYYRAGDIDPDEVTRYTFKEACTLMLETGHHGPWEDHRQEGAERETCARDAG